MAELFQKFGVDWKLLCAQVVNFGILVYVLQRFAYGPLLRVLSERKRVVDKGLDDAHRADKALQEAGRMKDDIIRSARGEAQSILQKSHLEAESAVIAAREKGEEEKARIVKKSHDEILMLERQSDARLTSKSAEHIIAGISALLKDEVTQEMNERLITRLVKKS